MMDLRFRRCTGSARTKGAGVPIEEPPAGRGGDAWTERIGREAHGERAGPQRLRGGGGERESAGDAYVPGEYGWYEVRGRVVTDGAAEGALECALRSRQSGGSGVGQYDAPACAKSAEHGTRRARGL